MSFREEDKMGDILATEANLLGMIKEYLKVEQFDTTVNSFDKECKNKGKLVSKPQGNALRDVKTHIVQKDLLSSFNEGDFKVFFELWTENIPSHLVKTDTEAQKLEFYLYIHFTIYPLRSQPERQVCISLIYIVLGQHGLHVLPVPAMGFSGYSTVLFRSMLHIAPTAKSTKR
ncbi:lisH domain-containing protein ARMC9-like [Hippocampus comes]|uniref:lisH domain-containing protein ARMC9-like n=1 Tax=Hippocampus comes TaxID=109280 RepID=UPI00094E5826|nr:PREDICTED: lisH domain-containing protein ARMC9-like [Hippocampus comes]